MPASDKKIKLASLMYYQVYGEEFPLHNYKQQDIDYIIEQLNLKLKEDTDIFLANTYH